MKKSHAAYAEITADQFIEFIRLADDDQVMEAFCRRFESLVNEQQRKRVEHLLAMMNEEFLPKEGQKSRSGTVNRDSSDIANVSIFGAKAGSKTFVIDELLASGGYTLDNIESASEASKATIKKRIRSLKSKGYTFEKSDDGRLVVSKPVKKKRKK